MEQFENWEREMSSETKTETSLKQLQNIYFKNKNKKKELQQISQFNKNCIKQAEREQKQQQQPTLFDTKNLLNENEVSFKTVQKIYIQLSCIGHIICIALIFLLNQHYFIRIVSGLGQIILMIINYLHYYFKKANETVDNIKCLNNRSKYILMQIGAIIVGDLLALVITYELVYSYFIVFLLIVDFTLLGKLYKLYRIQKNMDMEFEQVQFSSFQYQFKSQTN